MCNRAFRKAEIGDVSCMFICSRPHVDSFFITQLILHIDLIIHLDDMNITKIGNHDKRVKEATEAVLKNKSVYNALKWLTND